MRHLPGLTRIALSPWSFQAADPDEMAELDARAESLDATVSTIRRRDHRWMARARAGRGLYVASFVGVTLEGAIRGALDEFEAHTRDRYTAEELLTIYNQTEVA